MTDREDLGALLQRLLRVVLERETALLTRHDVEMWEYMVLAALQHGPAPTQNQLAALVGRDKTRLIGTLDGLQARRLVERNPDPRDRRNRVVSLTPAGRERVEACRADIRRMEADLLGAVGPDEAEVFVRVLSRLAGRRLPS
jgi:DNA-binding MarR family transcriptional regulator